MYNVSGHAFVEKPYSGIVTPTRLYDASRNKNHGTHTDITMVQRPSGLWERSLNGSTSKIVLVSTITLLDDTSWTVELWLKPNDLDGLQAIYGYLHTSGNQTKLYFSSGAISIRNDADDTTFWNVPPSLTQMQHLVIVCDGSDSANLELFVDGISKGPKTMADSSQSIKVFGAANEAEAYAYEGLISRISVHNYALSQGQIKNIYEKQLRDWFI